MIKRGLSVGDTFSDGGRTYKVERVLENGCYVSKAVSSVDEEAVSDDTASDAEMPEETAPDRQNAEENVPDEESLRSYSKREIQRMKKADLEKLAAEIGVEFTDTESARAEVMKKLGL